MIFNDNTLAETDTLLRNWWAVLLRGLLGIAFGIITFIWPGLSLASLVLVYGAFAFADGVLALVGAIRGETDEGGRRWAMILRGVLGLGAGIVTILWPGITTVALLSVIAAWAVVGGVLEIVSAIRLRRTIRGEWAMALSGLLSIALGVMLIIFPVAGALALVLWVGAYMFATGIVLTALSLRLRSWGRRELPDGVLGTVAAGSPSHR
jgi:uncharacterized membrane protein HdeD (DUF308 family)